jgi:C-terminal processing protease CtpA/Prc
LGSAINNETFIQLFRDCLFNCCSSAWSVGAVRHWRTYSYYPRAEGVRLQILDVTSNFPAAQAGLAAAQVIIAIDGVPTMGLRIADCLRRIQGKAGTKVVLEIEDLRHNWTNSIEVTRNVVEVDLSAVNPDAFNIPPSARRLS